MASGTVKERSWKLCLRVEPKLPIVLLLATDERFFMLERMESMEVTSQVQVAHIFGGTS